ncbi:V-type ATP synthase subunit A [Thermosediminibacter oceani]|uniref:V-type ATP synthase alpha chain n=1 Tax=Thermosediminibacter oceani (strain ATCC BAA-1034 / DSM 16646 / JW/IW-1228P) TaxID=555079 RepID=D9RYN5_THEOJ|nr:V-type ATP synthase subunit A [Thermosediminibacter oceani]ADL08459.1 H+transporting two-sector ATPase alpha/beta subunit central region [Thermosediminibacter oceani DSM 16646]
METGRIIYINGPVVRASGMKGFTMREMVLVGEKKLIGEVISLDKEVATIQVYEETSGLRAGEPVTGTGKPLSVKLGPGILGNIFDGIERPLSHIYKEESGFIPPGIGLISLDEEKLWDVEILIREGDHLKEGDVFARVQETSMIVHRIMVPPGLHGRVVWAKESGRYTINDTLALLENEGKTFELKMCQEWPVREPRPVAKRMPIGKLLVTGQRVIDTFFPLAKGGTAAIPGGFGTGKTITQHQLAKWSDADIIVYIGCGERGNEMTEVLEDFPKLQDPRTGKPLMDRTVLIANTSNMPVAAREASIYTGITIAEYFRDMGYNVALMADSTSRWAEALREIAGRLEEMPAEEGYPAYLASRLAQFYERAGYFKNLNGSEGSITIIGAVSPAGGDFSEPVTQATKRVVGAFLALDKELAYARHFPSINWLLSYSGYVKMLEDWFSDNVAPDLLELRAKMLGLLREENKLMDIVKLVGEDVLPDDQRLVLEIARVLKMAYLQQNAYHKEDSYVPLDRQYTMLKVIDRLYERALSSVKKGIPIAKVKNEKIFNDVIMMKYTLNFDELIKQIDEYFDSLESMYKEGVFYEG